MANVIGTDVSFYQDDPQTPQGIDFAKMRQNAEYVIIRAGQNLWTDRDFKVNWREAKRVGLPRGSYWFYDSRVDPKRQAELWASLFGGDTGEDPGRLQREDSLLRGIGQTGNCALGGSFPQKATQSDHARLSQPKTPASIWPCPPEPVQ